MNPFGVIVGLTISTFRLNSRNFISDRLTDNTDNAFNLSSIRIAAPRDAQAESRQSDVSVTLHRSTTPEFARRKSDNNVATTSIVQHLVRYVHVLAIDTHFS